MNDEYLYSELPAIQLFQRLGYQYLNGKENDERHDLSEVILKNRLLSAIQKLNPWINENNLFKAYDKLTTVQGSSLMEINEQVWELIRGASFTVKQEFDGVEEFKAVFYIDYQNPENNDFLVVNQFRFLSKIGKDAEDATRTLFDLIHGELNIVGWEFKGMVINDIENKLVRYLKTKMERTDAKSKAKELVELLRNNKNA